MSTGLERRIYIKVQNPGKAILTLTLVLIALFVQISVLGLARYSNMIETSGTINYITAKKLQADGRWLKDSEGNIVQLVGYAGGVQTMSVTDVGLWEREGRRQGYDWSFDETAIVQNLDAMKNAGANTIRSHMAMWFVKEDGNYIPDIGKTLRYKQNYHRIIGLAGRRGMYVIIDGMTITPDFLGGGGQDALPYPPYQDREPNQTLAREIIPNKEAFIDLWLQIARHLKDLPNVIFEPWNEPHAPNGYNETVVRQEWFEVLHDLVAAFRLNGIDHPVVVQWGYSSYVNWDFPEGAEGYMSWVQEANSTINDPITNLIFSTHLYRTGGAFGVWSLGQARQSYDDVKKAMQLELIEYTAVNLSLPVLIGEIGASIYTDPHNESLALDNALQVLNEWKVSWLVYWWRFELEWTLFDGDVWIPPFNDNGKIVRDAMLDVSS